MTTHTRKPSNICFLSSPQSLGTRIWCIYEVFVACQKGIPTTVILPEIEVDAVDTWREVMQASCVSNFLVVSRVVFVLF